MATYAVPSKTMTRQPDLNSTQNLVNPEWEMIDLTPDIFMLFNTFNFKFFSGQLSCVELEWSVKMYQCAGICYSRRNRMGMACVIRLSEPLLKLRSRKDLVETLLHEMIHAWNFIRGIMEENGGHGQNFLSKMNEINKLAGTKISVYHTFIDEVNVYKKHWWRCDGVCKDRSPYFGFVKRTMNRVPGPNDNWWKQHEQTCGGAFIKVKEPEKIEKKRKVKENGKQKPKEQTQKMKTPAKTSPGVDIRKFFKPDRDDDLKTPKTILDSESKKKTEIEVPTQPKNAPSSGVALGGKSDGKSRLLDLYGGTKTQTETKPEVKIVKKRKISDAQASTSEVVNLDDEFLTPSKDHRKSFHVSIMHEFDDEEDEIIFIDDEFDDNFPSPIPVNSPEVVVTSTESCQCPCCDTLIEVAKINDHLDQCLGI